MVATDTRPDPSSMLPRGALIGAGVLLAIEFAAIGTIFKHAVNFNCLDNWPQRACSGASGALVSLYCILGALLLFAMLKPQSLRALLAQAGTRLWPLAVNGLGVVLALVPVAFLREGEGAAMVVPAFAFWTLGMGLLLWGLLMFLAPARLWREFLRGQAATVVPMMAAGAALPYVANLIRPFWNFDAVAGLTFSAVSAVVRLLGYEVETWVETKVIGGNNFYIDVAPQCSGIEGLALVTLFVTIYLWIFRADLRFPRALWLYPIGLIASAIFNVVRISVLLIIGLEGNAELAVGGFHSHAGWLMFTLVALGVVALAQSLSALQKNPDHTVQARAGGKVMPLRQDPVAAQILPFAIFMFSALLAQAFAQNPGVIYPARVLAMTAAVALFVPLYLRMPWRADPVAIAAGAAIGLMWVVIPVADPGAASAPYGALTGAMLAGWIVLRGIGTVVLVPLIEELFFRVDLESRLRFRKDTIGKVIAAMITAALFAALHDRIVEAFFAGLVFSWVAARRNRLSDAILAHAVANAIVFGVALATGSFHIM